jgi:uncharacterized protein
MSAKMILRLAFAAALSCGVAAAIAPAAAQEPSANAIAMAKELITVKGGSTTFERIVPGVIESAKNSLIPTNPNVTRELNEVAVILHKDLDPKSNELITDVSRIYARRFTEQELKDLLAFYKSPLGKKAIVEEGTAVDLAMKHAQTWADDFYEKVLSRFRMEMKKKGYEL